jgi:cytochrome c biogenesis protein CcmG/thiol:disulfide interchange protein DsbE
VTGGEPPAGVARRSRVQLLLLVGVAAVIVAGGVVAVALTRSAPSDAEPTVADGADRAALLSDGAAAAEGEPLPAATLPALDGYGPPEGRDLTDLRGTPLVVNFWASWCAPCVREMPALQRVAEDTGVTVVGIDYVDRVDEATALADELGITYELLRDDDGSYGQRVGVVGMPTTLLVDADGVVVEQLAGELSEDQLRSAVDGLLR